MDNQAGLLDAACEWCRGRSLDGFSKFRLMKQSACVRSRRDYPGVACVGNGARGEPWTKAPHRPDMKQTGARRIYRGSQFLKGPRVSVTSDYHAARRSFRRQDGSQFIFIDGPVVPETREIRRHRAEPVGWAEVTAERFAVWLRASQQRFDLALAVICFFLVMGAIFLGFGGAAYLFFPDPSVSWTFWALGLGQWLGAMLFFFSFLTGPSPRHGWSS